MGEFGYEEALRAMARDASASAGRLLDAACPPGADPVLYLADFGRHSLFPLDAAVPAEPVDGTVAGRAFITGQAMVAGNGAGPVRAWVPITEQTARIGVLAVNLPDGAPASLREAELLGVFTGLLVGGAMKVSDEPWVRREGARMSLPASIQWNLLPPWAVRVPGALAAGVLEPAYDVAGDIYDYAAADGMLHFAVIDGMGHGIGSTLLTGLAIGAYRRARRDGLALAGIHVTIDEALASRYDDLSFATGIIGTLNTTTGRLQWTCAGHPPPLLLRRGVGVHELDTVPTLPFGLGTGSPAVNTAIVAPGDAVLVYSDGVTEAHDAGRELFGLDRLTGLLSSEAEIEQEAEELLGKIVRAITGHQEGDLRDDATLLLLQLDSPHLTTTAPPAG
jgi:phosphoserine phosphatase RsbU/P